MNHTPVSSSLISSVAYDPAERILELVLRFGTYRYYDVPVGVYRELLAAPSKGKYFHRHISRNFNTSPNSKPISVTKPTLNSDDLVEILTKYIPPQAVDSVTEHIIQRDVQVVVTRARSSKLGDYSNPRRYGFHKITVNHNLNPFRFLITLLHEIAHLDTWNEYRRTVSSHGPEWKENFQKISTPFLERGVFPQKLADILRVHLRNPAYASCVDHNLERALKAFDEAKPTTSLEELPMSAVFRMRNGLVLRKGRLLRKRFVCHTLDSKITYRVGALAEVSPVSEPFNFSPYQPVPDTRELLVKACRWNKIDLVKDLLAQGIEVNAVLPNGQTALQVAVQNGHNDLASFLISQGAKQLSQNLV